MFPAELLLLSISSMDKVLFQTSQAGKGGVPAGRNPSSSLKSNHKPRVHLIVHVEITQANVPLNTAWNRGWKGWEEHPLLVAAGFVECNCKQGLLNRTLLSQLDHPLCSTLKVLLRCLLPQTWWIFLGSHAKSWQEINPWVKISSVFKCHLLLSLVFSKHSLMPSCKSAKLTLFWPHGSQNPVIHMGNLIM